MRASFTSRGFGHHVVLTGHVTYVSAQTFISEFFHPDRGYQVRPHLLRLKLLNLDSTQHIKRESHPFFILASSRQDLDVIMLRSCDPEPQLVITMNNAQWDRRIKYLHGSPFRAEVRRRSLVGRGPLYRVAAVLTKRCWQCSSPAYPFATLTSCAQDLARADTGYALAVSARELV